MSSKRQSAKKVAKNTTEIDVAKVQNLRLRGRIFYYHRDLPNDVRHLFNSKSQLWVSLKTSNLVDAKRKCLELTLEHDSIINEFRFPLGSTEPPEVENFTDEYLELLAEAWASWWLRDDEQRRINRIGQPDQITLLGLPHTPASLRNLFERETSRNWDGISPLVTSAWLKEQGVSMALDSESFLVLAYKIRLKALQCIDVLELRTKGQPVVSPPGVVVDKPKKRVGIVDMLQPWKVRQNPKDSSIVEFERTVVRFTKLHPGLQVQDISSSHIVEFRDWLTSEGLASATVEKQMNIIKALLGIAHERSLIKFNPASKIRPPKASGRDRDSRTPFTVNQLNQLFSSPIYSGEKAPKAGKGAAALWLPLLGLFTGARVEELCQLRLDDVLEEDGIHFIYIRRKHEEQETKNDGSVRRIPLHQELVKLGILNYVNRQRIAKQDWLFSELVPDIKGNRSGNWSKWFHRYLRETVGITDSEVVFHSLRHNFKEFCRICEIREDVHDALTGHKNGSVGRSYGGAMYPLGPLAGAIKAYLVKGVKLPDAL